MSAESGRAWLEAHRDEDLERKRKWAAAHREVMREQRRKYMAVHPEAAVKYKRQQQAKYPERIKARDAVNYAIAAGRIPPASTLTCACGNPAQQYHHHLGYAEEHWLHAQAVCKACHRKEHDERTHGLSALP